jgi:CRISPR-associated protein Csb2
VTRALVLQCNFVAHSYQGARPESGQNEELDWPPSPARIHQALMAVALIGVPAGNQERRAANALQALQWLEQQRPPDIVASVLSEEEGAATRFRLAIPQNNPDKNDLSKRSTQLKPPLRRRAVGCSGEPLRVGYIWRLEAGADQEAAAGFLEALADLAAQVRYLGRAEDQIEAQVGLSMDHILGDSKEACETWRPAAQGADISLWVARDGTTNGLIDNHFKPVPARARKPPARRFLRLQGYGRDAVAGLLPVHVAIFQVFAEPGELDDPPLSFDAENAGVWRSRIRQSAVELAMEVGRWDDPDLAQELITGHPPGQPKPTEHPHLAFVPLPSISLHGKADGRVRRFALLGYARPGAESEAGEVYRSLCASLDGEAVEAGKLRCRLQLLGGLPERDNVWVQFLRSSRVWHSVTPVALARGFKIPTHSHDGSRKLTSNERHLRKLAEWTALLRASLCHVRLPEELAATCSVTLTPSPLLPSTNRAESYRPPGESAVLTHAHLEFTGPFRGPLIVGDRRYQGYGLFFPA